MGALRIDRTCRRAGPLCRVDGRVVVERTWVAGTPWSRLVGMLGTPGPGADEALILVPCSAVHGVGMRQPIAAALLDRDGRVLRVVDPLPRHGARARGARVVVEAAMGVLDHVRVGDVLDLGSVGVFPHRGTFRAWKEGSCHAARALSGHRERPLPRHDRRTS